MNRCWLCASLLREFTRNLNTMSMTNCIELGPAHSLLSLSPLFLFLFPALLPSLSPSCCLAWLRRRNRVKTIVLGLPRCSLTDFYGANHQTHLKPETTHRSQSLRMESRIGTFTIIPQLIYLGSAHPASAICRNAIVSILSNSHKYALLA